MTEAAILAAAKRLKADGRGYRTIAAALGATRHQVRHWLKESKSTDSLPAPIEPRTATEFAARITAAWQKAVWGYIEAGRWIVAAKKRLDRGEFLAMVEKSLPFGKRTAQRLMAVASDPRIINAAHGSHLPASWRTAYELTRLDDATFEARIADGTIRPGMERRDIAAIAKRENRERREADLAGKIIAFPDKKYGVILADPEWKFETWSANGLDRAADNHYAVSETANIAARSVHEIAAADCLLLLWGTAPMLPAALFVMERWAFEYKTHAIWEKRRKGDARGPGYWFTGEHELLLIGTRGHVPAPAPGDQWRSIVPAHWRGHSVKPDWAHEWAEQFFPHLPKIELNARRARPGWDSWGAEAPSLTSAERAE
jgi:N6-adenosine-specific RNA methylase IME4